MRKLWLRELAEWTGIPALNSLSLSQHWIVLLAGLVATLFGLVAARRVGKSQLLLLFVVLAGCIGGALVGHWVDLAFRPSELMSHPLRLLLIASGGFSSLGVYAGATAAVVLFLRWRGESLLEIPDLLAPGLLVGAAIARMGCLFNGCDFGRVSGQAWLGLRYPRGTAAFSYLEDAGLVGAYHQVGLPMHPFPLYEAVPTLVLGLSAWFLPNLFGRGGGQRLAGCAIGYLAVRLVSEHYRADASPVVGGLTAMQLLCLLGIGIFGWLWLRGRSSGSPAHDTLLESRASTRACAQPLSSQEVRHV
ncbi:MAG: hypothetical protein AUK47_23410 [Deltaproteobacteria bacterium CG2_30_63_29]|nr:MAG: hypothetical protein AUK47_23410 [Deltaproteobacteria bacterium CG2_30_63_29]